MNIETQNFLKIIIEYYPGIQCGDLNCLYLVGTYEKGTLLEKISTCQFWMGCFLLRKTRVSKLGLSYHLPQIQSGVNMDSLLFCILSQSHSFHMLKEDLKV